MGLFPFQPQRTAYQLDSSPNRRFIVDPSPEQTGLKFKAGQFGMTIFFR